MAEQEHILVVEDEPITREQLVSYFEEEGFKVSATGSGDDVLPIVLERDVILVLLDIKLPGKDGLTIAREIRAESDLGIIMVTSKQEQIDKILGLESGADDYVTKPFGLLELLARVEALLRRARPAGRGRDAVLRSGDLVVDQTSRTVRLAERSVGLAPKEFDLLVALMARRGAAASRVELMDEVWGYPGAVVSRTVDTHVAELRRKLGDEAEEPRFVATVRSVGYRFVGPVE